MAEETPLNNLDTQGNISPSPTNMAAQGAEGGNRSSSASDMSNIQIDEVVSVPNVEVKHAPFQTQPILRGDLTEEQMKELGEKMRKEQAKKYFSLRVRASVLFYCAPKKLQRFRVKFYWRTRAICRNMYMRAAVLCTNVKAQSSSALTVVSVFYNEECF